MNVWEHQFLVVAKKFGEYPRVLDPAFDPPPEFYADLEAAGYTREEFEKLRLHCGRPEREGWIKKIATQLYWDRRQKFEQTPRASFLKCMSMIENGMRKHYEDIMARHSITANEVEQFILEQPDLFPSLPAIAMNVTDNDAD